VSTPTDERGAASPDRTAGANRGGGAHSRAAPTTTLEAPRDDGPVGRHGRARGLALGLRTVLARAYPRVVGANREPSWVFFDVVLPLLATLALLYVYRSLGAPARFEGYVIVGGAMTAFWMNTIWMMAMQFRWEKESGNLELYMAAPTHLMWILTGMAIGGSFSTTLRASAVVALGVFGFRIPFEWSGVGWALLAALVTIAALYGIGMIAASLFLKFGRGAENAIQTLQEPIYLVTGAYFPVRALGVAVAAVGSVVPLARLLDCPASRRGWSFASISANDYQYHKRQTHGALLMRVICIIDCHLGKGGDGYLESAYCAQHASSGHGLT
jgi:ABC-2 type transport system permease protein